ncbi:MAG: DMT family transporter [Pseudomonadota bacterium]
MTAHETGQGGPVAATNTAGKAHGLSSGVADYALLLLLSAVLALNFTMTKLSVSELAPALVVAGRLAIAAAVLVIIMVFSGYRFPKWGPVWFALAASALFGHTLPFSLLAWAQQGIDAGLAAILMATMPLFTLLMAQLFVRDEKPTLYSVAGFTLALVGIILLFGVDKLASLADQSLRQYAAVGAALCYGVNAIVTKWLTGLPWQSSSAAFMVLAFLFGLPTLAVVEWASVSTSLNHWVPVLYSGLMATAFAAVMIVVVVKRSGASFLSQINFIIPVMGVAFSIALVNESLPANGALALVIILTGVALARRRPNRTVRSVNQGA